MPALVARLLAAAVFLGPVLLGGSATAGPSDPGPGEIARALADDPVYVADDSTLGLTAPDLARLRVAHDAGPEQLFVVVLERLPTQHQQVSRFAEELLLRIRQGPALLVVYAGPAELPILSVEATAFDAPTSEALRWAEINDEQDLGTDRERLLRLVDRVVGDLPNPDPFTGADPFVEDPDRQPVPRTRSENITRWGLLAVTVVILAIAAASARSYLARNSASRRRTKRVAERVSIGRLHDAEVEARRAVRELGSALKHEQIQPHDNQVAWQVALDAYAEAGRLIDRARRVAEFDAVVAACARGSTMLRMVTDGRPGRLR